TRFSLWPYVVGGLVTAGMLLTSVQPTGRVGQSPQLVYFHLPFTLGDFAGLVNGRTPLVDFFPMYQAVTPYLLLPLFKIVGITPTTFSIAMTALSFGGLMLWFECFRRASGNAWLALLLLMVVLGTC